MVRRSFFVVRERKKSVRDPCGRTGHNVAAARYLTVTDQIIVLAMTGYAMANSDVRLVEYENAEMKPRGYNLEDLSPMVQREQNITIANRIGPKNDYGNLGFGGDNKNGWTFTTEDSFFTVKLTHKDTRDTVAVEQRVRQTVCIENQNKDSNLQCSMQYARFQLRINGLVTYDEWAIDCCCKSMDLELEQSIF